MAKMYGLNNNRPVEGYTCSECKANVPFAYRKNELGCRYTDPFCFIKDASYAIFAGEDGLLVNYCPEYLFHLPYTRSMLDLYSRVRSGQALNTLVGNDVPEPISIAMKELHSLEERCKLLSEIKVKQSNGQS
jgi:hypothetical protein